MRHQIRFSFLFLVGLVLALGVSPGSGSRAQAAERPVAVTPDATSEVALIGDGWANPKLSTVFAPRRSAHLSTPIPNGIGVCGDSEPSLGEECDDGNFVNGDGCDATCLVEAGWDCSIAVAGITSEDILGDGSFELNDGSWTLVGSAFNPAALQPPVGLNSPPTVKPICGLAAVFLQRAMTPRPRKRSSFLLAPRP